MKFIYKIFEKHKPKFNHTGKFRHFHSLFEATESFLFSQNQVTTKGCHIRDSVDMKRLMIVVFFALIPPLIFGLWNTGYWHYKSIGQEATVLQEFIHGLIKVIPIILVTYITGGTIEVIYAQIRKEDVNEGFFVTGLLIPLILPVDIPLWMVAVATAFAIIIGKEAFGGTGMNIFNPALLARAFLFFAYPNKMTGDLVWISGLSKAQNVIDGFSGATPLAHATLGHFNEIPPLKDLFLGTIPGSIGETSTLAILLGASLLLITGVGNWRIMLSVFVGGITMSLIFNALALNEYMQLSPITQIMMGGFMFGAVYMATDPVTAAQTNIGKYIYGFLIGMLAIMIRVLNPAYPEGMMLSILLMNTLAPLIDHYVIAAHIRKRFNRIKVKN